MNVNVITLHPEPDSGRFDDSELQSFLEDRELLSVSEHFYIHESRPTLVLLLAWRPAPALHAPRQSSERPKADPAADLADNERPVYEALRRWRNERAKRDGRPAYIYLTNAQLVEVSRKRPTSLAELMRIQGIGEGKAGDFGAEIIAFLEALPPRLDHAS